MKARVKATGEIVEVVITDRRTHTGEDVYMTQDGCLIEEPRLDFNVESIDYWTRLEHQYAGMAMQGLLANHYITDRIDVSVLITETASAIAHALVEKLKEKEERK